MTPYDDEVKADRLAAGKPADITQAERESAMATETLARMVDVLAEIESEQQRIREDLDRLVDAAISSLGMTAGGQVGTMVDDRLVTGHPWATGNFKLSCNDGEIAAPRGWLVCDGTYVRKDEFYDLYYALHGGDDPDAAVDVFQLPTMTAPTGSPSHAKWLVRT